MLRIYKSGRLELSGETFTVNADRHIPAEEKETLAEVADKKSGKNIAISDDGVIPLDPQEVEAIFADANRQANEIIARANEQARQELETTRALAQKETQELHNKAYAQGLDHGFAEGVAAKAEAIKQCIDRLEAMVATVEGKVEGLVAQYEDDLRWAVLEVCSKVLHKTLDRDELELTELVKDAVDRVKNEQWIDLHVSAESVELIDRLQRELAPIQQLDIVPDNLPSGSCILDTPGGRLDASVDAQLENLKEYFRSQQADF